MRFEELHKQTSLQLFDTIKINRERLEEARKSFNSADATVFLSIGLHFDVRAKICFPVVVGTQWVTREQAIELLQAAIDALNPKLLEDLQGKGGEG